MNNPLMPQGSLHQQSKGKSNVRIAVFTILAIHVVLLGGLLMQGCKPTTQNPPPDTTSVTNELEPITQSTELTNEPFATADTNGGIPVASPTNGGISAVPGGLPPGTAPEVAPVAPVVPVAPTPDVAPITASESKVHSVAKGESLSTIAGKYKISVRSIEEANPGVNPLRLQIGQKLNIPVVADSGTSVTPTSTGDSSTSETVVHTVKTGDALEKIARQYKTTVKAIKAENGLKTDRINVGDKLKIPVTTSVGTTTNP